MVKRQLKPIHFQEILLNNYEFIVKIKIEISYVRLKHIYIWFVKVNN